MQKPTVTYDKDCVLMMLNKEAFNLFKVLLTLYYEATGNVTKNLAVTPINPTQDELFTQLCTAKEMDGWHDTVLKYALQLIISASTEGFVWQSDINSDNKQFKLCQLN